MVVFKKGTRRIPRPFSTGEAVDAPREGTRLTRATERGPMFWFSWVDFNPDTEIYGALDDDVVTPTG